MLPSFNEKADDGGGDDDDDDAGAGVVAAAMPAASACESAQATSNIFLSMAWVIFLA